MDDNKVRQPQLSIIVPVYNVMRFLRECLDSIASQTFADWEAILVDDGSTDGSGAVCDEYAARDPRFRVIHKANGGQSSARNMALDVARGEYIGFVDSDDFIKPEMYAVLVGNACKYNADIAVGSYIWHYTDHDEPAEAVSELIVADRDRAMAIFAASEVDCDAVWNKIYRREVFNVRFPEGKIFEDTRILGSVFRNARTVVYDPGNLYYYRVRKGSTMTSLDLQLYLDIAEAKLEKFSNFKDLKPEMVALGRSQWLRSLINNARYAIREWPDAPDTQEFINTMSHYMRDFTYADARRLKLKNRVRYIILRYFPSAFRSLILYQNRKVKEKNQQRYDNYF